MSLAMDVINKITYLLKEQRPLLLLFFVFKLTKKAAVIYLLTLLLH